MKGLCCTLHVRLVSMTTVSWRPLPCDRHCPSVVHYLFGLIWCRDMSRCSWVIDMTYETKMNIVALARKKNNSNSDVTRAFFWKVEILSTRSVQSERTNKVLGKQKMLAAAPSLLAAACRSKRSLLFGNNWKKTLPLRERCYVDTNIITCSITLQPLTWAKVCMKYSFFPFSYRKSE